jgi:cyclophilin family peptidyl-prolyl cis-trans isomerase
MNCVQLVHAFCGMKIAFLLVFGARALPMPRRDAMRAAAALVPLAMSPPAARASTSDAKITDRVRLEFVQQLSAEENKLLIVDIGLFGVDAPTAASVFKELVAGTLKVPCQELPDDEQMIQRSELARKQAYKNCEGATDQPVTYAYSQVWRVLTGRRIDAGAVAGKFALRAAPTTLKTEAAGLSHDQPGLLSVRRGGGTFDFALTAAATPEYDDDFAVIGRVLDEESLTSVRYLASVPVVKAADAFGQGEGSSASREKACAYGSPNAYCAQLKPLRKVTLQRASLL